MGERGVEKVILSFRGALEQPAISSRDVEPASLPKSEIDKAPDLREL